MNIIFSKNRCSLILRDVEVLLNVSVTDANLPGRVKNITLRIKVQANDSIDIHWQGRNGRCFLAAGSDLTAFVDGPSINLLC